MTCQLSRNQPSLTSPTRQGIEKVPPVPRRQVVGPPAQVPAEWTGPQNVAGPQDFIRIEQLGYRRGLADPPKRLRRPLHEGASGATRQDSYR